MSALDAVRIGRVSVDLVRPLRLRILRPGGTAEMVVFHGDDDPRAVHLAAQVDAAVVGVASLCPMGRTPPADAEWQLRGMATDKSVRGTGVGGQLLQACLEEVALAGGALIWCNARQPVLNFYRKFGFIDEGEPFHIPDVGPHLRMWRRVSLARAERVGKVVFAGEQVVAVDLGEVVFRLRLTGSGLGVGDPVWLADFLEGQPLRVRFRRNGEEVRRRLDARGYLA